MRTYREIRRLVKQVLLYALEDEHQKFKNLTFTRFKKKKRIYMNGKKFFWKDKLEDDVYKASTDTTFAVYNKKYFKIVKNEAKFFFKCCEGKQVIFLLNTYHGIKIQRF